MMRRHETFTKHQQGPAASSCAKQLTEYVVVKVVMLEEGHVAVAFAAGVSDQAPVSTE